MPPRSLIERVVALASPLAAPSKAFPADIGDSPCPIVRQLNVCLTDLAVLRFGVCFIPLPFQHIQVAANGLEPMIVGQQHPASMQTELTILGRYFPNINAARRLPSYPLRGLGQSTPVPNGPRGSNRSSGSQSPRTVAVRLLADNAAMSLAIWR